MTTSVKPLNEFEHEGRTFSFRAGEPQDVDTLLDISGVTNQSVGNRRFMEARREHGSDLESGNVMVLSDDEGVIRGFVRNVVNRIDDRLEANITGFYEQGMGRLAGPSTITVTERLLSMGCGKVTLTAGLVENVTVAALEASGYEIVDGAGPLLMLQVTPDRFHGPDVPSPMAG